MAMVEKKITSAKKKWMTNIGPQYDIVENILSRLRVKSLVRFRCVSKAWCMLIKNPSFINLHLIRSKEDKSNVTILMGYLGPYSVYYMLCGLRFHFFYHLDTGIGIESFNEYWQQKMRSFSSEYDGFKFGLMMNNPLKIVNCDAQILGSSNGIVCITPDSMTTIFLSNPSTRQIWEVPHISDANLLALSNKYIVAFGFGYNAISDDYKIVRAASFLREHTEDHPSEVHVYSSRNNLWRRIQDTPYRIYDAKPGELVNGALHWVGIHFPNQSDCVIAFDLRDEKFQDVPLPGHESTNFHVAAINEKLSIICNREIYVEAWVMEEYGTKESWVKLFKIVDEYRSSCLVPLFSTKEGAVICLNNYSEIVEYDQNNRCLKTLINLVVHYSYFYAKTYVESLVSLDINNGSVGVSGTKQQGKEKEA